MSELLIRSVFTDNLARSYFLGMCTFLAVSRHMETAFGLGLAMIMVETFTVPMGLGATPGRQAGASTTSEPRPGRIIGCSASRKNERASPAWCRNTAFP